MAKIDIISGFLGAGKTTLIKKLIEEAFKGEKLVLIENEFGEIGIDGGFLKNAGIQVTEMNSGCICCSLVGDFGTALQEVIDKYNPDRIIIEPSGVGKLSDVIKAVKNIQKEHAHIDLNSFTTVADVNKCKMYMKNFGEFFNNQIENANTIVLSRTQTATEEKIDACVKLLKEHNDKATMITTPWEQLEGKTILKAMESTNSLVHELLGEGDICPTCGHVHDHDHHHDHDHECCCGHDHDHAHEHEHEHDHDHECCCGHDHEHEHEHEDDHECCCGHDHDHDHHHHHADEVFTSWGTQTAHRYEENQLKEILQTLAGSDAYGMILRAKGIVQSKDEGWFEFDLVPGEFEVRMGEADYTGKLCVIGSNLDTGKIEELFSLV